MPITFNKENFQKVLTTIKENPSCWRQEKWHCGSSHCFAGWAQILSGKAANDDTARKDARKFLGLTIKEADCLFQSCRTIEDFEKAVDDGYDRDGLDKDNNSKPE